MVLMEGKGCSEGQDMLAGGNNYWERHSVLKVVFGNIGSSDLTSSL
jgi:hypothetical protein